MQPDYPLSTDTKGKIGDVNRILGYESTQDPQQTVIAKGSVVAQDRALVAAREIDRGRFPVTHEKTKLVRSYVRRCLNPCVSLIYCGMIVKVS